MASRRRLYDAACVVSIRAIVFGVTCSLSVSYGKFDLNGKCAAAARSSVWVHEDRAFDPKTGQRTGEVLSTMQKWDYKIKVDPWLVFGQIDIFIPGTDIELDEIWAAEVSETKSMSDGLRMSILLGSVPQADQQFDIEGSGKPASGAPKIVKCSHLEPPKFDCKLEPELKVLNEFAGNMALQVKLQVWQTGAIFDVDFGSPVVISETWGVDLVDVDEDKETAFGRFRLHPEASHVPIDRRSSFGFSVTPPLMKMPKMMCKPVLPFPPPPPPSPPIPPPNPPPYLAVDETDCFLGGQAVFTVKPAKLPGRTWSVLVSLQRWSPGVQLTVDFIGDSLRQHPLRIVQMMPLSAVKEVTVTSHSAVIELLPSPVRQFSVVATGAVESLGRLSCCCAPSPSPPPPSPLPPRPPPMPRPPPPRPHTILTNAALALPNKPIHDADPFVIVGHAKVDEEVVSDDKKQPEETHSMWTSARVTYVTLPLVLSCMGALVFLAIFRKQVIAFRARSKLKRFKATLAASKVPRAARKGAKPLRQVEPDDDGADYQEEMEEEADEAEEESDLEKAKRRRSRKKKSRKAASTSGSSAATQPEEEDQAAEEAEVEADVYEEKEDEEPEEPEDEGVYTRVYVECSEPQTLKVALQDVETMEDLQNLVADVCEEAAIDDLDEMLMSYRTSSGKWKTVTRSVTMKKLKSTSALRLAPNTQ